MNRFIIINVKMGKFVLLVLGGFGGLLANGYIAIPDVKVLVVTYLFCFFLILFLYIFVSYLLIRAVYKIFSFFSSELGFFQWIIIFILCGLLIFGFREFRVSGYISEICKNVSLRTATHILFPGHGEPMEINLDG